MIDEGKNQEADKIYVLGMKAWNINNYEVAKAKFEEAYNHCTPGYSNEKIFKDSMKRAEAEIHNVNGDVLYDKKKFGEALKKYQQAIDACPSHIVKSINIFKKNMSYSFRVLGGLCCDRRNFFEAKDFHMKAHQIILECFKSDRSYKSHLRHAEAEMYNNEGRQQYEEGKYDEAMKKFSQAVEKCPKNDFGNIQRYKSNMDLSSKKRSWFSCIFSFFRNLFGFWLRANNSQILYADSI